MAAFDVFNPAGLDDHDDGDNGHYEDAADADMGGGGEAAAVAPTGGAEPRGPEPNAEMMSPPSTTEGGNRKRKREETNPDDGNERGTDATCGGNEMDTPPAKHARVDRELQESQLSPVPGTGAPLPAGTPTPTADGGKKSKAASGAGDASRTKGKKKGGKKGGKGKDIEALPDSPFQRLVHAENMCRRLFVGPIPAVPWEDDARGAMKVDVMAQVSKLAMSLPGMEEHCGAGVNPVIFASLKPGNEFCFVECISVEVAAMILAAKVVNINTVVASIKRPTNYDPYHPLVETPQINTRPSPACAHRLFVNGLNGVSYMPNARLAAIFNVVGDVVAFERGSDGLKKKPFALVEYKTAAAAEQARFIFNHNAYGAHMGTWQLLVKYKQ